MIDFPVGDVHFSPAHNTSRKDSEPAYETAEMEKEKIQQQKISWQVHKDG